MYMYVDYNHLKIRSTLKIDGASLQQILEKPIERDLFCLFDIAGTQN